MRCQPVPAGTIRDSGHEDGREHCESLVHVTDRPEPPSGATGSEAEYESDSDGLPAHQPLQARWDPSADEGRQPTERSGRNVENRSALGRFAATYGWRAYALPILVVVTVFVVVEALRGAWAPDPSVSEPSVGELGPPPASAGVIGAPPGDGQFPANLPTGSLPDGGRFTESGAGTWRVLGGTTEQVGVGEQHVFNYTVEVENGVDTSAIGGDEAVARMVDSTLANPKSWVQDNTFAFRRIDSGQPDFRISLSSRQTTRQSCGFEIPIDSSCYNSDLARVVLSEARWARGALAFEGDIGSYRQYLVNHEVGHAIGYHQHEPCESDGGLAPVMMQQTFGVSNNAIASLDPDGVVPMDGKSCRFNPWPYPRG